MFAPVSRNFLVPGLTPQGPSRRAQLNVIFGGRHPAFRQVLRPSSCSLLVLGKVKITGKGRRMRHTITYLGPCMVILYGLEGGANSHTGTTAEVDHTCTERGSELSPVIALVSPVFGYSKTHWLLVDT